MAAEILPATDADGRDVRQTLYKPISTTEFRVVHLLPGKFSDEIECVLETRSSRIKTRYEALSYQRGDESKTKPIRLAHSDSPPPPSNDLVDRFTRPVNNSLEKASRFFNKPLETISTFLWNILYMLGAVLLWCLVSPKPVEKPAWVPSSIPRCIYIFPVLMVYSITFVKTLRRAYWLILEVAETKPWLLIYNPAKDQEVGRDFKFETFQVTTNLEMALRHLRQEKRVRTFWIDALCVNQDDEYEKRVQVQILDCIYANASYIVVWLGGYHGIGEEDCSRSSPENGCNCNRRHHIEAAFEHIWAISGWRILFYPYFDRQEARRYHESRQGFLDIAKRGWWERLWVIQEITLATGPVHIHCGHYSCEFEQFGTAQSALLRRHPRDKELRRDFGPSERISSTIEMFRSGFHDRGEGIFKMTITSVFKVMRFFLRHHLDFSHPFYDASFPERLQRVLFKTSGQFKCHDDRDKLYAVLGIAGGSILGRKNRMTSLVGFLSSATTRTAVRHQMDGLWNSSLLSYRTATIVFSMTSSWWGSYCESKARHLAIYRPEHVVASYQKIIEEVAGGPGERRSRVEFFTALAGHLARETKSLLFLDAASCGEDQDARMPSWVPTWSRKLRTEAYDYGRMVKTDQPRTPFGIAEGGKKLRLAAPCLGKIRTLSAADLDHMKMSPWNGAFEKMLILPKEWKEYVADGLALMAVRMREKPLSMMSTKEIRFLNVLLRMIRGFLKIGTKFIEENLKRLVYTFENTKRVMGFLEAGKAVAGDRLVFVPGCFHQMALRRGRQENTFFQWKLVGLVKLGSGIDPMSYTNEEWAQLIKDGAVQKFIIE